MQNNKSKGFRNFVKGKGYYIVLLICAVTVGVSGYFVLKDKEPILTTPDSTVSQDATNPSRSTAPSSEPAKDVVATQPQETVKPTEPEKLQTQRPVEGEEIYTFAADFLAFNETTRDWRTHEGADYAAPLGTEVCAAASGTVHTVYEDKNFGMTVVLQHADGYTTHYSNLAEEVAVSVGQSVSAGDVLGTVGQTANVETAAQTHLHFAVFKNNKPMDPEKFFS